MFRPHLFSPFFEIAGFFRGWWCELKVTVQLELNFRKHTRKKTLTTQEMTQI